MKHRLLATAAGLALATQVALPAAAQLLPAAQTKPSIKVQPKSAAANLPAPAGGVAEIAETTFDVGRVDKGDTIEHSFQIKNTGTGVLSIHAKPG